MPKFDENHNIVNIDSIDEVIGKCNLDGTQDEIVLGSADVGVLAMNTTTIYYTDGNDDYRLYSRDIESGSVDLVSQDTLFTRILQMVAQKNMLMILRKNMPLLLKKNRNF